MLKLTFASDRCDVLVAFSLQPIHEFCLPALVEFESGAVENQSSWIVVHRLHMLAASFFFATSVEAFRALECVGDVIVVDMVRQRFPVSGFENAVRTVEVEQIRLRCIVMVAVQVIQEQFHIVCRIRAALVHALEERDDRLLAQHFAVANFKFAIAS